MGYSPGFLLKKGRFSTFAHSLQIDTNSRASSQKLFQEGLGGVSESLERFKGLAKIRLFLNRVLQPRIFAQKRPIFDQTEFTQNRHKQSRKWLEILLGGLRSRFREFGAISTTCQNPPCSKPWAIAQAFCSKTASFLPSQIHSRSTQTVALVVRNYFRRVQEAFQRVWSDLQDLPKSALLKTMGYSPGVLLKNGQFSTRPNSSKIDTNSRGSGQKSFQEGLGVVSESLERFRRLAKIRPFQNHGLQPRLFAQKRPIFHLRPFTLDRQKQSRLLLEIILGGFRRRFREFGAISTTCQNPPFSKPWAIAQAFCSKTADFRPDRIYPKSTQTVAEVVRNPFRRVQEAFQRVWSDFVELPKSALFKTMGYSPGFLLKNGRFSTFAHSLQIDTNSRPSSQKLFQEGLGGVSESLERFRGLDKIRLFLNHGLQPRIFAQKRPIFDQTEFTRNRHKQSRKWLEIILGGFRRRFREFGAISTTCQNPPFSKPWAIAQAFCSKTADFRPDRIYPKSTQTVAEVVRNHFRRVQEAFQRVWSDFDDLPKSALFKTMGYSPGFLLKNGLFSTFANSLQIDTNSRACCQKLFQEGLGGVSESLERFKGLAKIRLFLNHGLQPRIFAQKRPIFDQTEFTQNRHKKSRKWLEILFGRAQESFQRVWSDFDDLPKSALFKTMGYIPGFLLKNGIFSTFTNSLQIDTNSRACCQKLFQEGLGGVSESLERFTGLAKIRPFENHGLQPRRFAQKRPIFDQTEFSRNRHKQSWKWLEIILGGFRRRFREFGAIYRTCQNPPFSKPWAIAQAFFSKTANFRPDRIHPKSTQTVAEVVRNPFRRVQEAFQRVWSDFVELPKSALFKTMGYSPGFLLKNGRFSTFAHSLQIDTNSRGSSQKLFQEGLGGVSESLERFRGLDKIRLFLNHGLQPRIFAQKRPIFDQTEFTRNRHKQSRKWLEIILGGFRRRFREFGAISTTCQNPPFSKPWAQAFCSKTADFRPDRIYPKSTQTVAEVVRNHFRRVQEAFQRVWSDFDDLPKSALFKTMGYSPGFLLKNGLFSTFANSLQIDTNSRACCQKLFQEGLGGVSESLERFKGLAKIRLFLNHGLQPRIFAQKRPIFDQTEFTQNRHKKSRKWLEILFGRAQESFQRVWSDFDDLPKSALFKTMGYIPGFLLKNGIFSTFTNSLQIDTNSRACCQKLFQEGLGGVSESLERFTGLAKIRPFENHGLQPRRFAQKRPIFDQTEFSRNRHKQSWKWLEIILGGFRRRFREFGAIYRTCQNPPFSKPWAIAQAFFSKTANFRPDRIHPKSTQTVAEVVRNPFKRVQEAFQRVWSDFDELPKSALFKTMGYSPGFLLKNGRFSTFAHSLQIDTNSRASSQKLFQEGLGGVSESLERFKGLAKIRPFQNHGLQLRLFAQKRPIFDQTEFTRNRHKQSRKWFEILLGGFRRRFREFGAISMSCQIPPCSKPWAIPRLFAQKGPIFDLRPFTLDRHKQSRKQLEIILGGFRRRFREFGAI